LSASTSRCGTRPTRRLSLLAETLTEDARYLDPIMAGDGFALVAGPDAHHDRVRFRWSLSPNGGDPIAIGVEFATVAEDGRMRSVAGFLEPAA
jgi:hypothetical protein